MNVAMYELKVGLSRYVALARSGEVIVITSHDKLVARLVAAPFEGTGVATLIAEGGATWNGRKPVPVEGVRLPTTRPTMGDTVIEDRG